MAIGWLAILTAVPWAEVVKKAPEVAESAKKLWNTLAKKYPKSESEVRTERTVFTSKDQEISWLKDRLTAIETTNSELHNQMLTSAELIKALADQNTQLIKRVELNHLRILRLAALTIFIGIVAVISIIFAISR
jgi:predicted RNase H-like nuclease (RuvC/YqgF family)